MPYLPRRDRVMLAVRGAVLTILAILPTSTSWAQTESLVTVVGVGVEDVALAAYRQAVSDAGPYLVSTHGVSLTKPVIVWVHATTEQYTQRLSKYFRSEAQARVVAGGSGAWAGDHEVLLDHSRLREAFRQYYAASHELTHMLQIELAGSDREYSDRAWKSCWMAEGHASFVGWKVGDGRITSYARARSSAVDAIRRAPQFSLRQAMGSCGVFRPLQNLVRGDAAYGMSMLGIEALVDLRSLRTVADYFRGLQATTAEVAFAEAFKVSMTQFLTEFDARLAREVRR